MTDKSVDRRHWPSIGDELEPMFTDEGNDYGALGNDTGVDMRSL